MNLDTTKRLLQLTTDLHSLNNKLYQLKITSEVFVVDENEYLVDIGLIEGEIENLIKEINNTLEDIWIEHFNNMSKELQSLSNGVLLDERLVMVTKILKSEMYWGVEYMRTEDQIKKKISNIERILKLLYKYRDIPVSYHTDNSYEEYTREIEFYKGKLKSLRWVLDEQL